VQWLTKAAEKNNPYAMNLLGDLYKKGVPDVLAQNFKEAFRLFSAASALGNLNAQGNLGVLYMTGKGVEKDETKAVKLFRDGAEKGDPSCMFFYAQSLENGVGVRKDPDAAKHWRLRAAEAGFE
jgi:TPR repeat protein